MTIKKVTHKMIQKIKVLQVKSGKTLKVKIFKYTRDIVSL